MTEQESQQQTGELKGRSFRLNPDVSDWAIMEFYSVLRAADEDPEGAGAVDGMAVVHDFAIECVHPEERPKFRAHARKTKPTVFDLLTFLGIIAEQEADRPTERSSDLSDGPSSTERKSAANFEGSGSPLSGLALVAGRPDLAVIAQDSRRAS